MSARPLLAIARKLAEAAEQLAFGPPVACVYNPLRYAWEAHAEYLSRYGCGRKRVLFVGMNPGPWGMVQCGVPFGDVPLVHSWLGISAPIGRPASEHPRRPVLGWACQREEPSGKRFWGLMRDRFGAPEAFFAEHFVGNACPLAFFDPSGINITPNRLRRQDRLPLELLCEQALARTIEVLQPEWALGVGVYATQRLRAACAGTSVRVEAIPHPSPASPAANRGWAAATVQRLEELGVWA